MKKRIVLFDEDPVYGSIIDQSLKSSPDFVYVGWYRKMADLVHQLKNDKPDLLLMEVPSHVDVAIITEIKKSYGLLNIVIVSSKSDYMSIVQALKSGASGYLIKYLDIRETIEDLNKLAREGVALSRPVARSLVKSFWLTNNSPLTQTERKVLKFVSLGHTYSSLANRMEISKGTAKTHLKNIYRKLNTHRKSDALERAYLEKLI